MFVTMFQVLSWVIWRFNSIKGGLNSNPVIWNDMTLIFLVFMISTVFMPYSTSFEFYVLSFFIIMTYFDIIFINSLSLRTTMRSLLPCGVSYVTGMLVLVSEIASLIFRPLALFARPAAHLYVYNILYVKILIFDQFYIYLLYVILITYEFIIISIQSYVVTVVLGFSSN